MATAPTAAALMVFRAVSVAAMARSAALVSSVAGGVLRWAVRALPAWARPLFYYYGFVFRSYDNKAKGLSVRCLRDSMETSPRKTAGGFILQYATGFIFLH